MTGRRLFRKEHGFLFRHRIGELPVSKSLVGKTGIVQPDDVMPVAREPIATQVLVQAEDVDRGRLQALLPNIASGWTGPTIVLLREAADLKLVRVSSQSEWEAYHQIRRHVLFDLRGLSGYDENHPDDRKPEHLPLIFVDGNERVGAVRLDLTGNGKGVVRTVAIVAQRQRQGIGRAMMAAVESLAIAHDAVRLEAHAAPDAVGFYCKIGWEIVDAHRPNPLVAKLLK